MPQTQERKKNYKNINFEVPIATYNKFECAAKLKNMTKSEFGRMAINNALNKN